MKYKDSLDLVYGCYKVVEELRGKSQSELQKESTKIRKYSERLKKEDCKGDIVEDLITNLDRLYNESLNN